MKSAFFCSFLIPILLAFSSGLSPSLQGQGIDRGITWYGVLGDGLKEARRTGKPIFLVSAAPQCVGVSGMW